MQERPTAPDVTSLDCAGASHPGLVRDNNEDAHCILDVGMGPTGLLAMVADGVGGHRSGEVASALAVETVRDAFLEWDGNSADGFVTRALREANRVVMNAASQSEDDFNMQTTATAVVVMGDRLSAAHVGDCRLYRLRNGALDLLTRDHTMTMDLVRLHVISPEQALNHPARSQLTRSIGFDDLVQVDSVRDQVQQGDVYLLCSDGLWAEVPPENIRRAAALSSANDACEMLIKEALAAGGHDNITAVVLRVLTVSESAPRTSRWRSLLRRVPS